MNSVSNLSDFRDLLPASTHAQALACLKVSGPDSIKFLQGQTSCDFNQLTDEQGLQGAICNIKGRVIANFYALQQADHILLVMASDLVEDVLNHLKKFAVFFKTQLESAQTQYQIDYIFSQDTLFTTSEEPYPCQALADNHLLLALSQGDIQHYLYVYPIDDARAAQLPELKNEALGLHFLSGQAIIQKETSEKFIPQMLNMQLTHGVNFKKGCYTGQEIVARMQYRGNLKKHLYLLSANENLTLSPLMKLTNQDGKDVAEVVDSINIGKHCYIFAVISDESAQTALFHQESALTLEPLPYSAQS